MTQLWARALHSFYVRFSCHCVAVYQHCGKARCSQMEASVLYRSWVTLGFMATLFTMKAHLSCLNTLAHFVPFPWNSLSTFPLLKIQFKKYLSTYSLSLQSIIGTRQWLCLVIFVSLKSLMFIWDSTSVCRINDLAHGYESSETLVRPSWDAFRVL